MSSLSVHPPLPPGRDLPRSGAIVRLCGAAQVAGLLALAAIGTCNRPNTPSNVAAPSAEKSGKSEALLMGAALLQNKEPLKTLDTYLDGFEVSTAKKKQARADISERPVLDGADAWQREPGRAAVPERRSAAEKAQPK